MFSPAWFFGYDTTFNIISMFIALFIGIYSLKTYKLTKLKTHKYLSIAFFLIAISFFVLTTANLAIYYTLLKQTIHVKQFVLLVDLLKASLIGYIVITLIAYLIITALALKITERKTLLLIFLITLISLIPATNRFFSFHLIALVILGVFATPFFYRNMIEYTKLPSILVFLSFLFLTLSHVFLLFMGINSLYYVIGTGMQVISYLMLAIQLIAVYFKK